MLLQVHVETPIEAPGGFRGEERRWLREEFQYGGPKARSLTHRLWQEAEKTAESPQALGGPEGTGWCTRGDPGPEEETTWDLGPEHTSEVEGPVTRRPRYPWGHRRDQGCHLWSMGRVMPELEVSVPPGPLDPSLHLGTEEERSCKSRRPERGSALTCMLKSSFIGKISVSAIIGLEAVLAMK